MQVVQTKMAQMVIVFGELQRGPTLAQSTGLSGSAGAEDRSVAAANGRDMGGRGWLVGGMHGTTPVHFGISSPERGGSGFSGVGGFGGVGGTGFGGVGGSGFAPGGRNWQLYDEKYVLSGKGVYNPNSPQTWLQDLRDYLAGRSADLDQILGYVE